MIPIITIMLAYKNNLNIDISSIKFNDNMLAWAANENSKQRFRSNKLLWTIQCTQKYSKKIISLFKDSKNFYINEITKQFENLIGFKSKNLIFKNIHGWRYAYNYTNNKLSSYWSNKKKFGICADWMSGPKAENAYLNASTLFKQIKKNPPKKRV